jgi:hypothetical protein
VVKFDQEWLSKIRETPKLFQEFDSVVNCHSIHVILVAIFDQFWRNRGIIEVTTDIINFSSNGPRIRGNKRYGGPY